MKTISQIINKSSDKKELLKVLTVLCLFKIRVSDNVLKTTTVTVVPSLSNKNDMFGVFTTILRNGSKDDIHGCLGYWDNAKIPIDSLTLVNKICNLSYDAYTKDGRRNNFDVSLEQDSKSCLEISLMMLPIYDINAVTGMMSNGAPFNNNVFGIIFESGANRATFLPEVFINGSFKDIKRDIMLKAGSNATNGRFYAYNTTIINVPIFETIFSPLCAKIMQYDVANFYNTSYRTFVPHSVKDGAVFIDKSDSVRNISCIADVIQFGEDYGLNKRAVIIKNLNEYYTEFVKDKRRMRQSSAFLLISYHLLDIEEERQKRIAKYLYDELDRMEPRFEKGEALVALSIVQPVAPVLERSRKKMRDRLLETSEDMNEDIFELNWQTQFLFYAMDYVQWQEHTTAIAKKLQPIVETIGRDSETNYLAVSYECLRALNDLIRRRESLRRESLRDHQLRIFVLLNERKNPNDGLYYFKDGRESRLDITGHTII